MTFWIVVAFSPLWILPFQSVPPRTAALTTLAGFLAPTESIRGLGIEPQFSDRSGAAYVQETSGISADCLDLRMITRLARTAGTADLARMVGAQAEVTCVLGGAVQKWTNGETAKITQTSWFYPNRQAAKVASSW